VKIVIDGREYDPVRPETAELLHLMELKQQSKSIVSGGIGLKMLQDIQRRADAAKAKAKAARKAGEPVDDDEGQDPDEGIIFTAVAVFLSRRAAGEKITFGEACRVKLQGIDFLREDDDPADDDGAGEGVVPGPSGAPSTTSESPSHAG